MKLLRLLLVNLFLQALLGAFAVSAAAAGPAAPIEKVQLLAKTGGGPQAQPVRNQTISAWSLVLFAGALSENKLGFSLLPPDRFRNDFLSGLGLNWQFYRHGDTWDLELEPMFVQHFGSADFGELAAVVMARWRKFPWNECLPTTVAVGEGLSYVDQIPEIETRGPGVGPINHLNNLLIFEATFALASQPRTAVVLRLHHRSVAFNLFGENNESNFFCLGLRYNF
jgi:hypothetical protein